jgi:Glycosyl hydrolases family 2, sugar binding domain
VRFAPDGGAPESVTFEKLIDWTKHTEPGVKYFSGTATYQKTLTVPGDWLGPNKRVYLDLGKVAVMAQVRVNGKELLPLWKPPFVLDITDAARPGENSLEVAVVNLWVNRMIGDEQLPEDSERNPDGTLKRWPQWLEAGQPSPTGRYTFTSWRLWKKESPLQESGLIGPVTLRQSARIPVTVD